MPVTAAVRAGASVTSATAYLTVAPRASSSPASACSDLGLAADQRQVVALTGEPACERPAHAGSGGDHDGDGSACHQSSSSSYGDPRKRR